MNAMLWAMTRRAPASRAARTKVADASLRSRPVRAKPPSSALGLAVWGRLVSWLMTTSGRALATARLSTSPSKASPTAALTCGSPSAATRLAARVKTVTSCPPSISCLTRGRPMAPVPPATKICTN